MRPLSPLKATRPHQRSTLLRFCRWAGAACLASAAWTHSAAQVAATEPQRVFSGIKGTVVRFVDGDDARRVLASPDDWFRKTGPMQRKAITGVDQPVSDKEFARFQAELIRRWPSEEVERWQAALQELAPGLQALALPLPAEVLLLRSPGNETGGVPYTRANAIVLPEKSLFVRKQDSYVLANELFHIALRHAPTLADKLIAHANFEVAGELEWPARWTAERFALPDSTSLRYATRVNVDGKARLLMPIPVTTSIQRNDEESIYDAMEVRLLEVSADPARKRARPVLRRDGSLSWWPFEEVTEYAIQMGTHPEHAPHPTEIIAYHFVNLCLGLPAQHTTLPDAIRKTLAAYTPPSQGAKASVPPSGMRSK